MIDYTKLTDTELTERLQFGAPTDRVAFTEIYNRYWPKLYLHARHMLSNDDQAQDLIQEVFSWVWQNGKQLSFNQSLSAYLYGSVRNKVLDQIKHEKVKALKFEDVSAYLVTREHGLDEELNYKELVRIIESEIELMPPKMREIFELSRNAELPHKVIADQLGISEQTVRKQVQRALRLIRNRLNLQIPAVITILYLMKNG